MRQDKLDLKHFRKKSMVLLLLILISAILLMGCKHANKESQQALEQQTNGSNTITSLPNNNASTPSPLPSSDGSTNIDTQISPFPTAVTPDQPNNTDSDAAMVKNNGGLYVEYKGEIYYRQYTDTSYSPTGLWGDYEPLSDVKKNMMVRKEDGTTEVAFSDTGAGAIYISNNRMYLQNPSQYPAEIYSVKLDGSDLKEIGTGTIGGVDEVTGTLVCLLMNDTGIYQLTLINSSTGVAKQPPLTTPCQRVLAIRDSIIYCQGLIDFKFSQCGRINLFKINIDGTDEKTLVQTDADLYDFDTFGTEIPCYQFINHTLYFAYGGYAGTGNFYQGGIIAKVDIDGTNFEMLLGKTNAIDVYGKPAPETFYIVNEKNNPILYYLDDMYPSNATYALDLKAKKLIPSKFAPIYPEGKPFEYNIGVSVYQNAASIPTTIIPKVDYSSLGFDASKDYYYRIKDIEICDQWVYYKLEANKHDAEANIGWRDGYRRIKTQVVRQKLGGDTKEILFEY